MIFSNTLCLTLCYHHGSKLRVLPSQQPHNLHRPSKLHLILVRRLHVTNTPRASLWASIRPLQILTPERQPNVQAIDVLAARRRLGRKRFQDPVQLRDEFLRGIILANLLRRLIFKRVGSFWADGGGDLQEGRTGRARHREDGTGLRRYETARDTFEDLGQTILTADVKHEHTVLQTEGEVSDGHR